MLDPKPILQVRVRQRDLRDTLPTRQERHSRMLVAHGTRSSLASVPCEKCLANPAYASLRDMMATEYCA